MPFRPPEGPPRRDIGIVEMNPQDLIAMANNPTRLHSLPDVKYRSACYSSAACCERILVSVIMPVKNAASFLPKTFEGLRLQSILRRWSRPAVTAAVVGGQDHKASPAGYDTAKQAGGAKGGETAKESSEGLAEQRPASSACNISTIVWEPSEECGLPPCAPDTAACSSADSVPGVTSDSTEEDAPWNPRSVSSLVNASPESGPALGDGGNEGRWHWEQWWGLEVCIVDDHSTDGSLNVCLRAAALLEACGCMAVTVARTTGLHSSVGHAKNQAIALSSGKFLCFQDADDISRPSRIEQQLSAAFKTPNAIVGSNFVRDPPDASPRYAEWLNTLTQEQLVTSRLRECTLAMPTWFMRRSIYDNCDGFAAIFSYSAPEDLLFLYRHLRRGGALVRVPAPLVVYSSHEGCMSRSVHKLDIWNLRVAELEQTVLPNWTHFSIWNAGMETRSRLVNDFPMARASCIRQTPFGKRKT
eukprot:GHVT01099581.1.p1 GENE.GHVT01099581.1~~GHVT01099581.1.p1  ORF type:complete len:472 (-),score=54.76 GHVT01099581.1:1397-2812(-)